MPLYDQITEVSPKGREEKQILGRNFPTPSDKKRPLQGPVPLNFGGIGL
jgi:hypothetical protein